MKSKFEFKFDIGRQNKISQLHENMKAKSKQVYFTRKYSKSNQIYFTKNKFRYQSKLERNIQTISIKFNPQNKFEKKSIKLNNQSKYQPRYAITTINQYRRKNFTKFRIAVQFLSCKPIYPILGEKFYKYRLGFGYPKSTLR